MRYRYAGDPGSNASTCRPDESIRTRRPSRSTADPSSIPTSASPVSLLLRLTYSNRVMSSFGPRTSSRKRRNAPGSLREVDREVVLQAQVNQRAFQHLAVAGDIVVAARDDADDGGIRLDVGLEQSGDRQRSRGFGDDALILIEVEHGRANGTFVDGNHRHHGAGGRQRPVGQLPARITAAPSTN